MATTNTTSRPVKTDEDTYEYRGRVIYKACSRSGAYNPWRTFGVKFGFARLKDAVAHIDRAEAAK
jgi:hypothetical protein